MPMSGEGVILDRRRYLALKRTVHRPLPTRYAADSRGGESVVHPIFPSDNQPNLGLGGSRILKIPRFPPLIHPEFLPSAPQFCHISMSTTSTSYPILHLRLCNFCKLDRIFGMVVRHTRLVGWVNRYLAGETFSSVAGLLCYTMPILPPLVLAEISPSRSNYPGKQKIPRWIGGTFLIEIRGWATKFSANNRSKVPPASGSSATRAAKHAPI